MLLGRSTDCPAPNSHHWTAKKQKYVFFLKHRVTVFQEVNLPMAYSRYTLHLPYCNVILINATNLTERIRVGERAKQG